MDNLVDYNVRGDRIINLEDSSSVFTFLSTNYLYWLEALSLMKSLPDSIVIIMKLENWLPVSDVTFIRMLLKKVLLI